MSEDRTFRNRLEASRFLKRRGYKIGKSKLYRDSRAGKLRIESDGSIRVQAIWDYLHSEQATLPPEVEPSQEERRRFQAEQLGRLAQGSRYASESALDELIRDKALEWIREANGDPDLVLEFSERIEADVSRMIERQSEADNARVILLAGEKGREGGDNARS
jgi:hypothetical protein